MLWLPAAYTTERLPLGWVTGKPTCIKAENVWVSIGLLSTSISKFQNWGKSTGLPNQYEKGIWIPFPFLLNRAQWHHYTSEHLKNQGEQGKSKNLEIFHGCWKASPPKPWNHKSRACRLEDCHATEMRTNPPWLVKTHNMLSQRVKIKLITQLVTAAQLCHQ